MPGTTLPKLKGSTGCVPCMAKLDRLEWAAGLSFVSYGARIGIRVNEPAVLPELTAYLPPGSKLSPSPIVDDLYSLIHGGNGQVASVRRYNLLYAGSQRLARTIDSKEVLERLESEMHFNVAVRARRKLFIHAGVVGWHGRAIVIPGRSMSGKTSLTAALVRAGAVYYSDEYAVLDAQGRVHPYPKMLSLRHENDERREKCSAESLGGRVGKRPLNVGLIVVTKYRQGARWRPRLLSPGEAVLALLDNTVLARYRSKMALDTLQSAMTVAPTLKSSRGEAEEMVEPLLSYLESSLTSPSILEHTIQEASS